MSRSRQNLKITVLGLLLVVTPMLMAGCGVQTRSIIGRQPQLTRVTYTHKQLTSLPEPQGRIPVCVYNFRDQTGQYKPLPNVSSFSTAVTQGGASFLIQALKDSNWFVPVERENINDLLTERKIVRAVFKKNGNAQNKGLPPLEYARLMISGGITAFETNTVTGGAGAWYFGTGGAVEHRQDQVTIHLRAVDINSGRILKSLSTTKTIYSHRVQAGFFRFLSFEKIGQAEAGFTTNEPAQMCVAAAIQKAVIALVVEGIKDGLWTLKDKKGMKNPVVQDYLEEARAEPILVEVDPKAKRSVRKKGKKAGSGNIESKKQNKIKQVSHEMEHKTPRAGNRPNKGKSLKEELKEHARHRIEADGSGGEAI